jgi:hypothetical protein
MKSFLSRGLCRLLIGCVLFMSLGVARAGMIGVDQLSSQTGASADRAAVMTLLARDDVMREMQSQGVDPSAAKLRVAAMTDNEVSGLKSQLDTLPAGGSNSAWWWAGAVVVAIIIWWAWFR